MRRSLVPWLLATPALLLLLGLFVAPVLLLARVSLYEPAGGVGFYRPGTWSATAYADFLGGRLGRGVVLFTVGLGAAVAALSVVLGYPLAWLVHGLPRRAKAVALGLVVLPKLANVFVVLYGVNLLLGHSGPINRALVALGAIAEPLPMTHNLFGVLVAETYLILPYAVLILVPAFDRIDPNLVAAARGLGAGRWASFVRVTLPLSLPGVADAGRLALIWALGAFIGPVLLGGPSEATLSVLVPRYAMEYADWPRAAAVAVVSLGTLAVCAGAFAWPAARLRRMGETHE